MAEPGPSLIRPPKALYRGHNGFIAQVETKMSTPPRLNLHAVAADQKAASADDLRELHDAVQRRQFVENMMELKGTFFPGLDVIKEANAAQETSATVDERIEELQKKHVEEVKTLYQWHAQDYYDERLDLSRSGADFDSSVTEALYRNSTFEMSNTFDNELDMHEYAYLTTIQPLLKQRNNIAAMEKALKERLERRDAMFPPDIEAFRAMRNKDQQIRVARFLTLDDNAQDRSLQETKWVWRQVMPLINVYRTNDDFKAEIQKLLQAVEVQDPRKLARG